MATKKKIVTVFKKKNRKVKSAKTVPVAASAPVPATVAPSTPAPASMDAIALIASLTEKMDARHNLLIQSLASILKQRDSAGASDDTPSVHPLETDPEFLALVTEQYKLAVKLASYQLNSDNVHMSSNAAKLTAFIQDALKDGPNIQGLKTATRLTYQAFQKIREDGTVE